MSKPSVLILGAGGRFGAAAVQAFAAAGWTVLAQQRRSPAHALPAGAHAVAIALADTDALAARARDARVVVYAVNPPYTRWDEELLPLFHHGLAVAQRLGARFMLPGNVYNHGEHMPPRLDESVTARPSTRKGELRVAMEDELMRRAGQGLDSVVIRAGDFFGCGTGTWVDLMIAKDISHGRLVYPGPTDRVHAWAYLPDLARAFVAEATHAASTGDHRGCLQLHFEGHNVTGAQFIAALEQAAADLGLQPAAGFRLGCLPWPLLQVAGLVHPMLRELCRMRYLWRVPHALDGRRLQARAGLLPATPLAAALRQTLADLGHAPAPTATPQVRYR